MSSQAVIALGGNIGDVKKILKNAIELIEKRIGSVTKQSSLYKTSAWGVNDQPDFINQVIVVKTEEEPETVLRECLAIEYDLGRRREFSKKWGQRLIDLDVLFYDNRIYNSEFLTLPHPLLQERNFVLYPLEEILPEYIHPTHGKSISELKKICTDTLEVEKI